ncbi:MAG: alpha-N-acetylglucosaminidase [Holophagales bacterium]|jgi:alpha-N-acetylglucosaminidase|nr:alpha-N-acetylglucosaminidase [Holophagales bacterium]
MKKYKITSRFTCLLSAAFFIFTMTTQAGAVSAVATNAAEAGLSQKADTRTRLDNAKKLLSVAKAALLDPSGYPSGYIPYPQKAVAAYAAALTKIERELSAPSMSHGETAAINRAITAARVAFDKTWTVPINETKALIERVAGVGSAGRFILERVNAAASGSDVFEVDWDTKAGKPVLRGNNAVSLSTAFNYYLKYCLYQEFPYIGQYRISLPSSLPRVAAKHVGIFPYPIRHYFNEVDFRYQAFMYGKDEWQRRLDWLAMNGYNMFNMGLGEKNVWYNACGEFGYDPAAIAELRNSSRGDSQYFGTYNVSQAAFDKEGKMARDVSDMAFRLGLEMQVYPFTGQVPFAFPSNKSDYYVGALPPAEGGNKFRINLPGSVFDGVLAYPGSRWMDLPQGLFISADVSLADADKASAMREKFEGISKIYWKSLQNFYGFDAWGFVPRYAFRSMIAEQGFVVSGLAFSQDTLTTIQKEMFKVNPDMVWIQDAWRYQSWLSTKVDLSHSLLLELKAYNRPIWQNEIEPDGVPWVWCMTWNFGGNTGMDSGMNKLVYDIQAARKVARNMAGIGVTPEGGDTNPALYDLMAEMNWRKLDFANIDEANTWVSRWLKDYARRRYGAAIYDAAKVEIDAMWDALHQVVYKNFISGDEPAQTLTNAKPGVMGDLKSRHWASYTGSAPDIPYDRADIYNVWGLALGAADAAQTAGGLNKQFEYDLADITRQALGDISEPVYAQGIARYYAADARDKDKLLEYLDIMIGICKDMDSILAATPEFLLGKRLENAKARGATPEDIYYYERLERTFLTYWILEEDVPLSGGRDAYDSAVSNLLDYCNRHLAGLMTDYYGMRWQITRDYMAESWDGTSDLPSSPPYDALVKSATKSWAEGNGKTALSYPESIKNYPASPTGDPLKISAALYLKYSSLFSEFYRNRVP